MKNLPIKEIKYEKVEFKPVVEKNYMINLINEDLSKLDKIKDKEQYEHLDGLKKFIINLEMGKFIKADKKYNP